MKLFNKTEKIYSPINGKLKSINTVNDKVFSEKIMGDGIAILPKTDGTLYAPADAVVSLIFDTLHAITITTSKGAEILCHIGLDTVKLKGQYFKGFVKNNEKVKKGQKLIEFDIEKIKKDFDIITPVVITGGDLKTIKILKEYDSNITNNDIVMEISK